jgi:hypothetical protein
MTTDQVQHSEFQDIERRLGQRGPCKPDADSRGVAINRVGRSPTIECAIKREPSRGRRLFRPRVRDAPPA